MRWWQRLQMLFHPAHHEQFVSIATSIFTALSVEGYAQENTVHHLPSHQPSHIPSSITGSRFFQHDFLLFCEFHIDEVATKLSESKKHIPTGIWLYQTEEG